MTFAHMEEFIASSPHTKEEWLSVRPVFVDKIQIHGASGLVWILLSDFDSTRHDPVLVVDKPAVLTKKVNGEEPPAATYKHNIQKMLWVAENEEARTMRLLPSKFDTTTDAIALPYDAKVLAFRQQFWPEVRFTDQAPIEDLTSLTKPLMPADM